MVVCLAREDLYFGALWGERKVIPAGEMAGGRVSFHDTTGYMSKIRVQLCGKVAPAGCTQHIFRLGRVKTCVDQISSAHFTLDENGYPVVSPNDQGAPCCIAK